MHPIEDPDTVEPVADTVAPVAPAAEVAQPAAPTSFFDTVRTTLWNDDDVPDDATISAYTPETLKALPMESQIALRALVKDRVDAMEALAAERATMKAEREAQESAMAAREAKIKREQLAYSKAVADPEVINKLRASLAAKPTAVDPNSRDSIEAYIEAKSAERMLEVMAPTIQRTEEVHRDAHIEAAFADVKLDMKNPEDWSAVNQTIKRLFGTKENVAAMAAASAKNGGRSPVQVATSVVAAERAAAATANARQVETQDRMAAARSMATGATRVVAEPTDDELITSVFKRIGRDEDLFSKEYETNPKFRQALERQRLSA